MNLCDLKTYEQVKGITIIERDSPMGMMMEFGQIYNIRHMWEWPQTTKRRISEPDEFKEGKLVSSKIGYIVGQNDRKWKK